MKKIINKIKDFAWTLTDPLVIGLLVTIIAIIALTVILILMICGVIPAKGNGSSVNTTTLVTTMTNLSKIFH